MNRKDVILLINFFLLLTFSFITVAESKDSHVQGIITPIIVNVAAFASVTEGHDKNNIGVHLFRVHCVSDSCQVERLSINRCDFALNGKLGFRSKVDSWASWAGFVEAKLTDKTLELTIFQATHHALPAKIVLTFDIADKSFKKPNSFDASGFIDFLKFPKTDTFIEYQAVQQDELKDLDCPVFLPGLNH